MKRALDFLDRHGDSWPVLFVIAGFVVLIAGHRLSEAGVL